MFINFKDSLGKRKHIGLLIHVNILSALILSNVSLNSKDDYEVENNIQLTTSL